MQSMRSELSERIDHLSSHIGALERGQGRLEGLLEGRGLLQPRGQAESAAGPVTAPAGD